jgi:hypothetical protein
LLARLKYEAEGQKICYMLFERIFSDTDEPPQSLPTLPQTPEVFERLTADLWTQTGHRH